MTEHAAGHASAAAAAAAEQQLQSGAHPSMMAAVPICFVEKSEAMRWIYVRQSHNCSVLLRPLLPCRCPPLCTYDSLQFGPRANWQ